MIMTVWDHTTPVFKNYAKRKGGYIKKNKLIIIIL